MYEWEVQGYCGSDRMIGEWKEYLRAEGVLSGRRVGCGRYVYTNITCTSCKQTPMQTWWVVCDVRVQVCVVHVVAVVVVVVRR